MSRAPASPLTMRGDVLSALNRVLDALDHGRDTSVMRRSTEYREARAQLKRAEIRARNGSNNNEPEEVA